MNNNNKHDLFWELEAFNPRWQSIYKTVALAAKAAKALPMYSEWLGTPEGLRYQELHRDVPDTMAIDEAERATRAAMHSHILVSIYDY